MALMWYQDIQSMCWNSKQSNLNIHFLSANIILKHCALKKSLIKVHLCSFLHVSWIPHGLLSAYKIYPPSFGFKQLCLLFVQSPTLCADVMCESSLIKTSCYCIPRHKISFQTNIKISLKDSTSRNGLCYSNQDESPHCICTPPQLPTGKLWYASRL